MPLLRRIGLIFLCAWLPGGASAAPTWHGERDIAQALAETAFEGAATYHPGVRFIYGGYKVVDFGREVTDQRVDDRTREVENDLIAINADAAALRTLVDQGRRPSRDWLTCQRDPAPCDVANRLRTHMQTLPGGTGRFVARALADRRTLWVAAGNYAEDGIFDWLGGSMARLFRIRRVTPVMGVSLRGVRSPFMRTQWKSIRHIARRMDLVSESVFETLAGEFFRSFYRQVMDSRLASAVEHFQRLGREVSERRATDEAFRRDLVEAAPIYVPVVALAAARPVPVAAVVLHRAEDPVIDRASVQNQIARQFQVNTSDTTVREQDSGWHGVEDRSANIPNINLPTSWSWRGY